MPLTRPPSLSDSFAYHSLNIERADTLPIQFIEKKPKHYEASFVRYSIRFLFHILLIGLFETIFFFYYVSQKEDDGLNTDVNQFLNQITSQCLNLTSGDKKVIDDVINMLVNVTQINKDASNDSLKRYNRNQDLFIQAWMYEVGIFVVFLGTVLYSRLRKIRVPWKRIVAENVALIFLLGMYEYAFFSTIVYKFMPISTYELEASALQQIENKC